MRSLNFHIQSSLLAVAIILAIATIIGIGDSFFWLLMLQLVTGITQILFAILMISSNSTRTVLLEIYLSLAIIFLLLFFFGMNEMMELSKYGFVIIPWSLAILFWYISFLAYKQSRS